MVGFGTGILVATIQLLKSIVVRYCWSSYVSCYFRYLDVIVSTVREGFLQLRNLDDYQRKE